MTKAKAKRKAAPSAAPPTDKGLNPKEELYCQAKARGRSGIQSVIEAGYTKNEASAAVQSSHLLKNPKVNARIKELLAQTAEQSVVTATKILELLYEIASVDLAEAYNEDGTLKKLTDIPPAVRRAMSGLEVDEIWDGYGDQRTLIGQSKKVKFWSKDKALENLGKWRKLFTERVEVTDTSSLAERLARARKRKASE